MEKGYFREEGLEDVELITFPDDEPAQIEGLAEGLVDVAFWQLVGFDSKKVATISK